MEIVLFLVRQIFKICIETTGLIEPKLYLNRLPKEIPDLVSIQQVIIENGTLLKNSSTRFSSAIMECFEMRLE